MVEQKHMAGGTATNSHLDPPVGNRAREQSLETAQVLWNLVGCSQWHTFPKRPHLLIIPKKFHKWDQIFKYEPIGAVLIQTTTYNKGFNHFAISTTTTWSIYRYLHLVPWHLTLTTKQTLNLSPTQIIAPPIPHLVGLREYFLSTVGLDSYHYSLCSPLISILLNLIRFNLQTPILTQPLSPFCSFFSCHSAIVLGILITESFDSSETYTASQFLLIFTFSFLFCFSPHYPLSHEDHSR